jgi:hypothetical protein
MAVREEGLHLEAAIRLGRCGDQQLVGLGRRSRGQVNAQEN